VLAHFDPTLLMNGIYHLRLVATDTAGRMTTTAEDELALNVRGNFKVGRFTGCPASRPRNATTPAMCDRPERDFRAP